MSDTLDVGQLPEGFTVLRDGDALTIVNKHRDLGDVFSLFFLGVVVVLFASGIGGKLFDVQGVIGALALTSPLWGWLLFGALTRAVNTTRVTVAKDSVSVKVGPLGRRGSRELGAKDIGALAVRAFENRSSTRGGSLMITKTFSLWLTVVGGKELLLLEPFDTEVQAKALEKVLSAAIKGRKLP